MMVLGGGGDTTNVGRIVTLGWKLCWLGFTGFIFTQRRAMWTVSHIAEGCLKSVIYAVKDRYFVQKGSILNTKQRAGVRLSFQKELERLLSIGTTS